MELFEYRARFTRVGTAYQPRSIEYPIYPTAMGQHRRKSIFFQRGVGVPGEGLKLHLTQDGLFRRGEVLSDIACIKQQDRAVKFILFNAVPADQIRMWIGMKSERSGAIDAWPLE